MNTPLPRPTLTIVFAAVLIRALDGYCTPHFYRRIHTLSGSVDMLRWAGTVAIWVVLVGVWLTFIIVVLHEHG